MALHPNAKQQMLTVLGEDLKYLFVKNGMFLERMSGFLAFFRADKVLPKQGKFGRQLDNWIGDYPFIEFGSDSISDELSLNGTYTEDKKRAPLTEIEEYADTAALAQRLLGSFDTLPWHYTLTLNLGSAILPPLPDEATTVPVGDEAKVVASDLLLSGEFPLGSQNEAISKRIKGTGLLLAILGDGEPKWESNTAYFQMQVEGFVGIYGGGAPMDRVTSRLKAFLGLGLAMGLFSHDSKYDPSPPKKEWIVHRREGEEWAVWNKLLLDDEDTRTLRALKLWDSFGGNYPAEHKTPWLQSVLKQVSSALCSPDSRTLQLAAQWFWDSHKGTDEVLRYVRRMTTLEILLGEGADTSGASLGEILGNRLAYLIGKTHKERTETLAEFKKIYNIRSRILHRGKHRLVGEERIMMSRLQSLCESALKEEARIVAIPEKPEG